MIIEQFLSFRKGLFTVCIRHMCGWFMCRSEGDIRSSVIGVT